MFKLHWNGEIDIAQKKGKWITVHLWTKENMKNQGIAYLHKSSNIKLKFNTCCRGLY